ncbi:MAG: MBL fold metallo-hydrolase [Actinomycetota bacterium]|nr:MBL fold metallo-hydrolase [Actinomycetota bacterium]
MRLTVLGCAGSYGRADAACSAYLLEHDGFRLLVDFGPGGLGALQAQVGVFDIDAIVVSHLHADHCLDLASYVVARRYHPDGTPPPLPLHGPAGTPERLAGIYGQPGDVFEDVYVHHTLTPGERQIGPFRVTAQQVAHPVECFGLRFEAGGRALAYSADTGPTEALVDLARDADVLLCEASFVSTGDNPEGLHLTGGEAGEHAVRAGARRLLLTHLVGWNDDEQVRAEAEAAYPGPLEVVRAGDVFDV